MSIMNLPQLPQDKANHVIYGLLIFMAGAVFNPGIGLAATVIAGAAKEAIDATGRGNVEFKDFLATVAGGVLGFCCNQI